MANISKIQLPNGTTYDIKDSTAQRLPTTTSSNITLSDMNSYDVNSVYCGYVDNISGVTGYVTIRTYDQGSGRKTQIMESQDGVVLSRYYNGTTWTDFKSVDLENKTNISSLSGHFTFSTNSGHYYLQPEQPANPQDGDIWIG